MGCEALERLEEDWKHARSEYSYFTCAENKTLRQISDRQSKPYVRAAQEKMSDLSGQIISHQERCEKCRGEQSNEEGYGFAPLVPPEG
jgi:hypothetical protein